MPYFHAFTPECLPTFINQLECFTAQQEMITKCNFIISFLLTLVLLIIVAPRASSMSLSSAKWCPEQQIYVDGTIASSDKAQQYIDKVIQESSPLYIFGYGSLCWNPGQSVLASPSVKSRFGSAKGFVRTWAQKSADHRGTPHFNGLVCSLLTDEEYQNIVSLHRNESTESLFLKDVNGKIRKPSITEGVLYEVPSPLVQQCLEEVRLHIYFIHVVFMYTRLRSYKIYLARFSRERRIC